MISGSGGWPMSVFLTPDLKPFYAGTYFPPEDRYGRPGFPRLLEALADAYTNRREEVTKSAESVTDNIERYLASDTSAATVTEEAVDRAIENIKQRFDPLWGGFSGAPKFPHTMDLMLMMRHHHETGDEEALRMVEKSLEKMARGGMYDQLGGGFHRYSVDAEWLIPHFEKMLYDNALLVWTYLEAYQLTGKDFHARIARETLDYIVREMQSPEGGYFSSTDADSEGVEGKYFVWTPAQILEVLGEEDGRAVIAYYDVTEEGNFENTRTSALWIPNEPAKVAEELGISLGELEAIIERSKPKLLEVRGGRIAPGLDDKILTDWNGLMISAMARGAFVLNEDKYLDSATRAAEALLAHQWNGEHLLHTRRGEKSHLEGMQSDYSHLVLGLIDLYQASLDPKWLESAITLHGAMQEKFADTRSGGYFNTLDGQKDLLLRIKTATDNAVPSGNSIAAYNSLRLAALTEEEEYEAQAGKTLLAFGQVLEGMGPAYPMMLNAAAYYHRDSLELVLIPGENGEGLDGFLDPLRKTFAPYLVWVDAGPEKTRELSPIARDRPALEGKPTAYLCIDKACQAPTGDPAKVIEAIKESDGSV
jgi:uncharacterized protein YyaL (SSP411 family)